MQLAVRLGALGRMGTLPHAGGLLAHTLTRHVHSTFYPGTKKRHFDESKLIIFEIKNVNVRKMMMCVLAFGLGTFCVARFWRAAFRRVGGRIVAVGFRTEQSAMSLCTIYLALTFFTTKEKTCERHFAHW